jgi:hypothetical protein
MESESMKRLAMMLGLGWMLVLAVDGCTDRKAAPGKACLVNTDCDSPLSCSFGKCHQTCREARDCDPGQDCVRGADGNVCLLVAESKCGLNSDCVVGLYCAQDNKCRSQCEKAVDCATQTQQCVLPDKVCAEPRDIGGDGMLKPDSGGAAGTGGGSGTSGAGGTAGSAGTTGRGGSGTSGAGGSAGSAGTTGSGGGGQTIVLPCNGVEPTVNDTHAQATPLAINDTVQGCVEAAADHDFYQLTVPADAAGGILKIAITEVGAFRADATLYSSSDFAELKSSTGGTDAQSVFFYVATTPGASYQVEMAAWSPASSLPASRYTVRATYTALPDPYEPNDTRFDAKKITVGTPAEGYLFAGYASAQVASFDDYYKVTLAAGSATVNLDIVPANVEAQLWLYDPNGVQLKTASTSTPGGGLTVTNAVTAGDHYVRVGLWTGVNTQVGNTTAVPDNFTRPYRFTVTQ